jgi:hypothetical protein
MTTSTKPDTPVTQPLVRFDVVRWLVFAAVAVAAIWVLGFARTQVVAPFDNLITEQMCLRYGEQEERTLLDFERSNKFAMSNRTDGYCSFGPGPDGEPAIAPTIAETQPGALYQWAKTIGIVLQLGIVSIFVRLVTEPSIETVRFVIQRFRR